MPVRLLNLKCAIKPQTPGDCGYMTWESVKAAMERQKQRPFNIRVRPCMVHKGWVHYAACQKCEHSLWEIEIDGRPANAQYHGHSRKSVDLCVDGTGEIVNYPLGGINE